MAEQQRERDIAEMEAQMAHDTDQYFEARPQIMRTRDKETTFEAGFKAAWAARPLSHAEGDAVDHWAVRNPGLADQFRAEAQTVRKRLGVEPDADDVSPNDLRERIDKIEGAPLVACQSCGGSGLLGERPTHQNPDDAHCEPCPDCDPAPQVAVPEAVKERVVEAIAEALGDAKDCIRVWTAWGVGTMGPDDFLDVAGDPDRLDEIAEAAITAMLAAAPTAPAGEPECGCCGRSDQCDTDCDAQQPVSDPDGLTEPGRREAEQAYINCAFDYARDPIGSRDWVLFWNGWRARNAAPAPDEREIAAKAINDAAQYAQDWIEKQGAVTPESTGALDAVQAYANSMEKKS